MLLKKSARGADRDGSSTLQKTGPGVGQPRERILVFHPVQARARARTYTCTRARRACTHKRIHTPRAHERFFFLRFGRSAGRRSGRALCEPDIRHAGPRPARKGRRCRKRVRFNAALLSPFPHNARSPPAIGLLFLCSLRESRRVRARIVPPLSLSPPPLSLFLDLRSAFVATVKLALWGAHLSLKSKADPPTVNHERRASTSRGSAGMIFVEGRR